VLHVGKTGTTRPDNVCSSGPSPPSTDTASASEIHGVENHQISVRNSRLEVAGRVEPDLADADLVIFDAMYSLAEPCREGGLGTRANVVGASCASLPT